MVGGYRTWKLKVGWLLVRRELLRYGLLPAVRMAPWRRRLLGAEEGRGGGGGGEGEDEDEDEDGDEDEDEDEDDEEETGDDNDDDDDNGEETSW